MAATDIDRIRFVTVNFERLQGLKWAGGLIASLACVWFYPLISPQSTHAVITPPIAFVLFWTLLFAGYWGRHRAQEFYSERLGLASAAESVRRQDRILVIIVAAAVVYDLFRLGGGGPSAALLVVAALTVWRAATDWPWRPHLGGVGLALAVMAVSMPLPEQVSAGAGYLRDVATLAIGLGIVSSLLDHRLLLSVLPPRDRQPDELEYDDTV